MARRHGLQAPLDPHQARGARTMRVCAAFRVQDVQPCVWECPLLTSASVHTGDVVGPVLCAGSRRLRILHALRGPSWGQMVPRGALQRPGGGKLGAELPDQVGPHVCVCGSSLANPASAYPSVPWPPLVHSSMDPSDPGLHGATDGEFFCGLCQVGPPAQGCARLRTTAATRQLAAVGTHSP